MFLVRKLLIPLAMALAALAMTASSASAQIEVLTEEDDQPCPAVTIDVHHVEGGCHVRFHTTVDLPLHVYAPTKMTVSNCEATFEGRVDQSGEGYLTNVVLDPPHAGTTACTRTPCDEAAPAHTMIPWPFHIREDAPGSEEMELELCLRLVSAGEGGTGSWCDVDFGFADRGGHLQELGRLALGNDPVEVFCENAPGAAYTGPHGDLPAPVSFEPHLQTVPAGDEDVEVVHSLITSPGSIEVLNEDGGEHCPRITISVHTIGNGCHVEFFSTVDVAFHVYVPNKTTVFNCEVSLAGRIDENGVGYFDVVVLDPPHAGPVPCPRTACDEAAPSHAAILWPFHIREHGVGDEEIRLEFCLRGISDPEGTPGSWCDIRLAFADRGGHVYEVGGLDAPGDPTEVFCENSPANPGYAGDHAILPFPLSIEAHLESDPQGEEDVEVIH